MLKEKLKRILPEWIILITRPIRVLFFRFKSLRVFEDIIILMQPKRYRKALYKVREKAKNGEKIKIAFFVVNSASWKYENVYKLFKEDKRFEPVVLICPVVNYGMENMLYEMDKAYEWFKNQGYNVLRAYNSETQKLFDVKRKIAPDIIFYTNPYKGLIHEKYYITKFKKTLTCYVQYAFNIANLGRNMYDLLFHNILWKNFCETEVHKTIANNLSRTRGELVVETGYPGVDDLLYGKTLQSDVWKKTKGNLKKIIWAPHHTLDMRENLGFSNFMKYYGFMLELLREYEDKIQIAFKPHPLLRVKLYEADAGGKARTDEYYNYWNEVNNGQLETSDYIDLFNSSDAIIFDSGSFTAEYLYCGKPSLFLINDEEVKDKFNIFGKLALDQHYHAYNEGDIIEFINMVCAGNDFKKDERRIFYDTYLRTYNGETGSLNIYNYICDELFIM